MPMAKIKELRLGLKHARRGVSLDEPDSGLTYGRVGERAVMDVFARTSPKWEQRDMAKFLPFTKSFCERERSDGIAVAN
jgi:hypothetical protein